MFPAQIRRVCYVGLETVPVPQGGSGQEGVFRGMEAAKTGDPRDRRLSTWKEIASFFDCDERTVKRWESTRGLPVRRVPNGARSPVFAYESELRAWLDSHKNA